MSESHTETQVSLHYTRTGLEHAILEGLRAVGVDLERMSADDLAQADQFHARGKQATQELVALAGLDGSMQVLDVGGGIGGPARTLAEQVGCTVTVLDITEEYCRVGEALTRRVKLKDKVHFRHGSALEMPFPDASFDAVWTQHSSMNIPDKPRLYREVFRVLRGGGRLAMHEIMAGPNSPIHFPVPWAGHPQISHLREPHAIQEMLRECGFREMAWKDETALVRDWLRERLAATTPPPVGIHLFLGPDARRMFENALRNIEEKRVVVVQALLQRPD